MKPHVWPVDSPATTELWNKVCAAVQRQDLAGDILAMVQKSLDEQAAAIEHAEIVERLTRIFANVVKQCSENVGHLSAYCLAFVDLLNRAPAFHCKIGWASVRKSSAPAWLQRYSATDFAARTTILVESIGSRETPAVNAARMLCTDFIDDLTKNLIIIAQADREMATRWDSAVDQMLRRIQKEDGDFFGTEGQCDPRGDRRG